MASAFRRLNRHTLFVDHRNDDDQRPHYRSLKRLQPSQNKTTKKNRLSSDEASQPNIKASPRLPVSINSISGNILVPVVPGSPWDKYEKVYPRKLAGEVVIAVKLPAREEQFVVRSLPGKDVGKLLNIRQFHDENVITTYEIFANNDYFYLISEFMCISLKHVCRCPIYLNENQLVAIVKQVRIFPAIASHLTTVGP